MITGCQKRTSSDESSDPVTAQACTSGQTLANGSCYADTKPCSTDNGSGTQIFNPATGTYGSCQVTTCDAGFQFSSGYCTPAALALDLANGLAACQPTGPWSSATCSETCSLPNGTGTRTWATASWGPCTAQKCNSGFNLVNGSCVYSINNINLPTVITHGSTPGSGVYVPSDNGAGINTMFISQQIFGREGLCTFCPSWIGGMTVLEVQQAATTMKGTSLTHVREIIEAKTFFPSPGVLAHMNDLVQIMKLYQDSNTTVIFTLGSPIPSWWNPDFANGQVGYPNAFDSEGGRTCWVPENDATWEIVKNNLSQSLGLLAKALWDDPTLDKNWLAKHFIIDPFNELDGNDMGPDCKKNGHNWVDGRRAASMTTGIQNAFNQNSLPFVVTMPSGVMGNLNYIQDFYANGGKGMANIHYYPNFTMDPTSLTAYIDYAARVLGFLKQVNDLLPTPYKNNIILGEVGLWTTQSAACLSGDQSSGTCNAIPLSAPGLANEMTAFLSNQEMKAIAPIRLLWMAVDTRKSSWNTGAYNGGAMQSDITPKSMLYTYLLQHDKIDLAQDLTHAAPVRMRALNALPANTPSRNVDLMVFELIYNRDTLSALATKFSNSTTTQTIALISNYYVTYLARAADTGGLDYYVNAAIGGRSLTSIASEISNSPEAKIRGLYLAHLEREPDPDGMTYWLNEYNLGHATLSQIETSIRFAAECTVDCL